MGLVSRTKTVSLLAAVFALSSQASVYAGCGDHLWDGVHPSPMKSPTKPCNGPNCDRSSSVPLGPGPSIAAPAFPVQDALNRVYAETMNPETPFRTESEPTLNGSDHPIDLLRPPQA